MTRTIELPKNNKFIIDNNNIATIIGNEAHTIYFEAQKGLRELKKELRAKNIELSDKEQNSILVEFIETIIERELR